MSTYANDLTIHKSQVYSPNEFKERIRDMILNPSKFYVDYSQRIKAHKMDAFGTIDVKIRCVRKQKSNSKKGYEIRLELTRESATIAKFEKIKHNTIGTRYVFSICNVLDLLSNL